MTPVAKGMKVITPKYSITGKSYTIMAIINSIEVQIKAIREITIL